MNGELLLAWMSETGSGSITQLRGRAEWLAHTRNRELERKAFGRWMRDASALGHLEINWDAERWCVAPAAFVRLPRADGTAVLAGARRPGLVDALEGTDLAVTSIPSADDGSAVQLPGSVFVQFDSVAELRRAASAVGITYAGCFATRGAACLPPVELGAPAAPPAGSNDTLERRTGPRPRDWAPISATAFHFDDGLYRFEVNGRLVYRTVRDGRWISCDMSTGVFLELARTGKSCLTWRPETGPGRPEVGTVFLDFGAPLPALQARVLSLCSGLPPRVNGTAENLKYTNVPRDVAASVAQSLLQEIEE